MRKETTDHRHVDYFQSLEPLRERGLPKELAAKLEASLEHDLDYVKLCEATEGLAGAASKRAQFRRQWKSKKLKEHREAWMRERRDWEVLTRGKERADDPSNTDIVHSLWRLHPQRRRLAEAMTSDKPLPPEVVWDVMRDAHDLCTKDLSVTYLPGLEPRDGRCPIEPCCLDMCRSVKYSFILLRTRLTMAQLTEKSTQLAYHGMCAKGHRPPQAAFDIGRPLLLSLL